MDDATPHDSEDKPPAAMGKPARFPWFLLIGVALVIVLSMFLVRYFFRDLTPEVTRDVLRSAVSKWQAADIRDYFVEVQVQSRQTETYAVEVHGGAPTEATRNGNPLKQKRVFDTWSIPGMFTTIEDDVNRAESEKGRLILRCDFDPQTGAPLRYRRTEWGNDLEISWRITKFDALGHQESRQSLLPLDQK